MIPSCGPGKVLDRQLLCSWTKNSREYEQVMHQNLNKRKLTADWTLKNMAEGKFRVIISHQSEEEDTYLKRTYSFRLDESFLFFERCFRLDES